MAKRRMGRNLDALLGGAARERAGSATPVRGRDSSSADVDNKEHGRASTAANEPDEASGSAKADRSPGDEPVARPDPAAAKSPGSVPEPLTGQHEPSVPGEPGPQADENAVGPRDRLLLIGVEQIRRGTYQPRRLFDQELLQELADSIKAEGMIQPIIVRPSAGAFELVAGERRWRAAQLAGLSELPAIVRNMEDQSVAAVAVIENIQRKDLNPLEEAAAFERLCDEFGMTHKSVAESVGRSRASVTNLMRLLELHDEVKVLVDKGELEMGHARALLGAPTEKQHDLAKQVVSQGLTVRATEKLVRGLNEAGDDKAAGGKEPSSDPDIDRLSQKLGETLGAAVRIQHRSSGAGKLEISYSSVAELQGILGHIK